MRRDLQHSGVILVVVIVCAIIALLIFASIARQAAAGRHLSDQQAWQVQAAWLAQSGLDRAAWRLAADPEYAGETWTLPAEELAGQDGGAVQIRVETAAEQPSQRLVRIQADYPDDPQHRARHSMQAVVQLDH